MIAWGPAALCGVLLWRKFQRNLAEEKEREAAAERRELHRKQMGYSYSGRECGRKGSLIVDPIERAIVLNSGSEKFRYSYDDVLGWEARGQNLPFQSAAVRAMADPAEQWRTSEAARAAEGFYLALRDAERPIWRVDMPEFLHKKWDGILRSELGDRGAFPTQAAPLASN